MSSSGLRLSGRGPQTVVRSWEELVVQYSDLLPPYPGIDVVPVARVPQPPILTEEMSKPKALRVAALGYRAALERVYGPSRILVEATYKDPRAVLSSKHAHVLVAVLPMLVQYRIAPASWSAFSIHVWRNYVMKGSGALHDIPSRIRRPKKSTPPPPRWVFSPKRLDERTEWFTWHEATCRGGQLRISAEHRELMTRHRRLRAALLAAYDELTRERVQALVAEHLPLATFARLKKKATQRAEYEQDELEQAALGGEWLRWWG